jgi:pSer/pThr/pTyr-binding forkhead associated (FHA) protein
MWILQSHEPEGDPVTFRVMPGTIKTVGRAPRADFIVDAALVSRLHCRLEVTDDRIDVIDLESTNGTFVNGERVERARVRSGDLLQIGRLALKVAIGEHLAYIDALLKRDAKKIDAACRAHLASARKTLNSAFAAAH